MDGFDLKLLDALQQDGRLTNNELAERIGLSPSQCSRRRTALEQSGINPFMGWQVPNAVIALKQGAGRLIRDVHDRGVLVLCDPRISSKGYGRLFMASLPPMPRTRELADVQAFFDDTDTATITTG